MADLSNYSDEQLVQLLQRSNHAAYAEIYNRYRELLYLHALKLLKDEDEAQDVLQEVFIVLWERACQLNLAIPLRQYLYKAIKNRVLNRFAHRGVRAEFMRMWHHMAETDAWTTDQALLEKEMASLIEAEIASLPSKMREIFERSRFRYQSHKEIADDLGIAEKTVKKQVNNALKILRKRLPTLLFQLFF